MILKRLLQKEFTDLQIARDWSGLLFRAIEHILKLKYGFDYTRDRNSHIRDTVAYLNKPLRDFKGDKKSNGAENIMNILLTDSKINMSREKLIADIQEHFVKDYDENCVVTDEDLDYAIDVVVKCLEQSKDKRDIERILRKEFKI